MSPIIVLSLETSLEWVTDRPVSFEVISDDLSEMEEQALEIASWADNVYVKIPVTNTRGEPSDRVLRSWCPKA